MSERAKRNLAYALVLIALLALLTLGATTPPKPPSQTRAQLVGSVRIIDADTWVVQGQRIRLRGIDAPELDQYCGSGAESWSCGQQAKAALQRFVDGREVRCEAYGLDRYRRTLASCYIGQTDVQHWLVQHGWALPYGREGAAYDDAAQQAESNRAGIWRNGFSSPQQWRRRASKP